MSNAILEQSTNKVLFNMSIPISLGMLSTFLFQVVDVFFIGSLGARPLTALSFSSTVYFLLVGLFIGFSITTSMLVGKAVGESDTIKMRKSATISLTTVFLIATLVSGFLLYFIEQIFKILGADGEILSMVKEYMQPMLIGSPLLAVSLIAGSILRATGKIKQPEIIFAIAGVINIFLDYALVFGEFGLPKMDIVGVAYGTVASWVFIILVMSYYLKKGNYLTLKLLDSIAILKQLLNFSVPSITTQLMAPLTIMFITYLLGKESSEAVAAFGVAGRIETLLMIGILSISTALVPFISQNFGANKKKRIEEAIVFGGKASFYIGMLLMVVLFLFGKQITSVFSDNLNIIESTGLYFMIVSVSYVLNGLYIITSSIYNGIQLPIKSLKVMIAKSFLFTIPLASIGSLFSVEGIFIGLSVSNMIGGLYARYEMRKDLKELGSELKHKSPFTYVIEDIKLVLKLT